MTQFTEYRDLKKAIVYRLADFRDLSKLWTEDISKKVFDDILVEKRKNEETQQVKDERKNMRTNTPDYLFV